MYTLEERCNFPKKQVSASSFKCMTWKPMKNVKIWIDPQIMHSYTKTRKTGNVLIGWHNKVSMAKELKQMWPWTCCQGCMFAFSRSLETVTAQSKYFTVGLFPASENILNRGIVHWSVGKSCLTVCDPKDGPSALCPVSSVHYLPEFAQIHVHWVGDAI